MRLITLALALTPLPAAAQLLAPKPVTVLFSSTFQEPDLTESSGAAVSSTMPRVLYTINDSGNPPEIFAFDSTGRPLGRWQVPGVRNRDWEAVSRGPCPAGSCLFLGDIGDNMERQRAVVVYRIAEPRRFERFRGAADDAPLALDSLVLSYPDGPRDAEAMWVDESGNVSIVSKGRGGKVNLYWIAGTSFGGPPVTAQLRQLLPITPEQKLGRMVTDASLAPGGRRVAIRTYTEIYLFPVVAAGRLGQPVSCNVAGLERQGEGVAWLDDRRLLLTSEAVGGPGPIHIVTCGP
jgi:hypothetical protein